MLYVPANHWRPGMVLAREVSYHSSTLPLISIGQEITLQHIQRLQELNIPGLYIKSKLCDDVEVDEFFPPEMKQQLTNEVKSIFDQYITQMPIISPMVKRMGAVAQSVISQCLSKDECMMNMLDIKKYDTYTYSHSIYVGTLSVMIGIRLGLKRSELLDLSMAGLLHDVGKLDIPLSIINKPGALTPEEYKIVQLHPQKAVERLKPCRQISAKTLHGIACHHEKYNGTGYPFSLEGKSIPIFARILAIADVYDALTSERSYRKAWQPYEAVEYIMGCATEFFDFNVLHAFLKTVAAYPIGTMVQLSNGALAVVVRTPVNNNTLRPIVRLLEPKNVCGLEVDLTNDYQYLNVTITGTLDDVDEIPVELLE